MQYILCCSKLTGKIEEVVGIFLLFGSLLILSYNTIKQEINLKKSTEINYINVASRYC